MATRDRHVTQPWARAIFEAHASAAGLRWWSTYEAQWANVTLFDRAADRLRLVTMRALTTGDSAVVEAAQFFAMQIVER